MHVMCVKVRLSWLFNFEKDAFIVPIKLHEGVIHCDATLGSIWMHPIDHCSTLTVASLMAKKIIIKIGEYL